MNSQGHTKQQSTIWQDEATRLAYAELANVFYAREIPGLSAEPDLDRLQRRLSSLPYYVERAATHIVLGEVPLELDSHNGCWLARQRKCPQWHSDEVKAYYTTHASVGLVVPVMVIDNGITCVYLDTLDQTRDGRWHCNQFGWFDCSGNTFDEDEQVDLPATRYLLKPSKALMTAACCGHRWQYHKILPPRTLGLREMLLASSVNWANVRKKQQRK
ncbi:hypothetical protein CWB99_23150 [Pseudoalteromonas rubra]|uniref:Uncharacterized protein n=1 Tax=Pseudoalteromonas rubra TaxID=43658 RepID=A0A5S3WEW3_9GAMM|nr:hypothetical protein [Pseudoalteromonas rubra]TMP23498.1 hypothetical protein CWB99_23150 [Pseudoalteromonas rubra]TMP27837.1 hypothetical protein CWC00_22630 [Pseudoalteromonas rubra]